MQNYYDCVVMADCTINHEVHEILVDTIGDVMSKDGFCLYLAPRRGKSLSKFVKVTRPSVPLLLAEGFLSVDLV